jgi:hypothetical protein
MAQQQEQMDKKAPRFKDEAEAGAFWDTHSPLDYPNEFQEVKATFARPLIKKGLTIKLDEKTIGELQQLAHRRGIGPSTLVRMWILERLRTEATGDSRS